MIYDCFTFFNELELLEIRLNELDNVVDKFVLVEGTVTFTNQPKELFFKDNSHLFKKFLPKIIHIIVNDSPNVFANPWLIEEYQFNSILKGLTKAKKNDTILLSCVDEIPNADVILRYKNKPADHKILLQKRSYYYLNYVVENEIN